MLLRPDREMWEAAERAEIQKMEERQVCKRFLGDLKKGCLHLPRQVNG